MSALLGLAATFVAIAPLLDAPRGSEHGWIFTTLGIAAVTAGVRALRRNRVLRSTLVHATASVGIGTGLLATATMGWMILSSQQTTYRAPVSQPIAAAAIPSIAASPVPQLQRPTSAPSAMQTPATNAEDLGPLLAGLVFRLRQTHVDGNPWPTLIAPDSAHRVSDFSGVLQVLPADVDMQYLASADATAYRIRLFLVRDPSKYVDYDSNIDEITKSPSF